MASQLNIINLALSHIAQSAITQVQLDANSTVETQAALRVWEFARQETLRSYNWGSAKTQEALVVTTDYDPAVHTYAYVYPANCLAIRKVNVQTSIDETISGDYKVVYDADNVALRITTDIEDAWIEYTFDLDTPALFDSAFVVAFAHRLAAEMAISLNGDPKQAEAQGVLASNAISEAKRHDYDNKNEPHEANEKSNFVDARS